MSEPITKHRSDRLPALAVIVWFGFPILLAVLAIIFVSESSPYVEHLLKKGDFTNYWVASKLILAGRSLEMFQGEDVYFAAMRAYAGSDMNWHNWSYPPHYLLFVFPFALLDYLPAAALFLSVTLVFYLHAVSTAAGGPRLAVLVLLLPAIVCNIAFIQNGFLTSALLIYGLSLRQTRPAIAGIAIGMLTIKPQLGFLLPILLLFERRWAVIFWAAATALVMVGVTLVAWGPQSWVGYVTLNLPYQKEVMLQYEGLFTYMMPSLYGSLRAISVPSALALQIHFPVAILAFAAYLYCLVKINSSQARAAATVFATFMISPYSLIYDLGSLSAVAAIAVATAISAGMIDQKGGLFRLSPLLLVCILPLLTLTFAFAHLPISPLLIALAWANAMVVWTRCETPRRGEVPGEAEVT